MQGSHEAVPLRRRHVLQALAASAAQRAGGAPLAAGFEPDGGVGQWFGLMGPANMPRELVAKLNAEINRALGQADLKAEFEKLGLDTIPDAPAKFASYMKEESGRWAKVIKEGGIRGH